MLIVKYTGKKFTPRFAAATTCLDIIFYAADLVAVAALFLGSPD